MWVLGLFAQLNPVYADQTRLGPHPRRRYPLSHLNFAFLYPIADHSIPPFYALLVESSPRLARLSLCSHREESDHSGLLQSPSALCVSQCYS